jgi:hypothetical protein
MVEILAKFTDARLTMQTKGKVNSELEKYIAYNAPLIRKMYQAVQIHFSLDELERIWTVNQGTD